MLHLNDYYLNAYYCLVVGLGLEAMTIASALWLVIIGLLLSAVIVCPSIQDANMRCAACVIAARRHVGGILRLIIHF